MIHPILYFSLLLFELFFAIGITIYLSSLLFSSFKGSPYVPTKNREIDTILKSANLKKGQMFLDLGCGDARVVRKAVQQYGVKGIGIDINPVVLFIARLKSRFSKTQDIIFLRQDILEVDIRSYDIIYLFLLPDLLKKLSNKLKTQTKKSAIIISHGFKIENWQRYNYKTIENKPFPTYFYSLP